MPSIEVIDSGAIDKRDSAFPQAAVLPNGDILCSFSVGGGAHVAGGTDWARSTDGGRTWSVEGEILPREGNATNALKLSVSADGRDVYAYGSRHYRSEGSRFGEDRNEGIVCRSTDGGRTWSAPSVVPMMGHRNLEISHGVLPLASGRLLAPAATLESQDTLGKRVIAAVSADGGASWRRHATVFEDPDGAHGYFEQKLAEVEPGLLISTCWTVVMDGVEDREDHFVLSRDDGLTWSAPRTTGIMGQTMTPIPLGGDRLLVLYNRRYGRQGVVMSLVTFTDEAWTLHYEGMLYDPNTTAERPTDVESGVDTFAAFQFGFPTAVRLPDGDHLATHWAHEGGRSTVRWTRLRVDW